MRYDILLLDADETLFDYVKAERYALIRACEIQKVPFQDSIVSWYHDINDQLWKQFEKGLIAQDVLRRERFDRLAEKIGITIDSAAFNQSYTDSLGDGAFLIDGALALCQTLSKRCSLYIVTNGGARAQKRRLAKSGLAPYLKGMYISEEIGAQKPQAAFYERVFEKIGPADRSRVLMVGDSLTSDMRGGKNAGIDTCWFAPPDAVDTVGCTYHISSLGDLIPIVEGKIPLSV